MERAAFGLREVKLAADTAEMTFTGYGAVFGNIDSYGDVIAPGAFADTLAQSRQDDRWPAMLMQHGGFSADDMTPVGIWTELSEDGVGLKVVGKLADTPRGREVHSLLKMTPRPAIDGLSIGFIAKAYEPRSKPDDPRRKLTKIDLMEVSLVTFPANPKARVGSVKSVGGLTERDAERALRDAGLSRSEAKAVIAAGFKSLPQRDAGDASAEITGALKRLLATIQS